MARKSPAFSFYPDSWYTGTAALSYEEKGIYIDLLCFSWGQGPFNDAELRSFLSRFSRRNRAKFEHILSKFWTKNEHGKWENLRLEFERSKQLSFRQKQQNNGKLGGRPRETKNPSLNPNETQTEPREKPKQKPSVSVSDSIKEDLSSLHAFPVKIDQPNPTPSSREEKTQNQSGRVGRQEPSAGEDNLPEQLRTPEFLAAWKRWLEFRLATDGRLNAVQQDLQIQACLRVGAEKAVRDIDASILGNSRGQLFDSDRYTRRESKPKTDPSESSSVRSIPFGFTSLRVVDGIAKCPFAAVSVDVARVDSSGQIMEWLVDDFYRDTLFAAAHDNRQVFIEAFIERRPELLSPEAKAKFKTRSKKLATKE